ncbi:MAG: hypothetical protein CPDRYMAC_6384 [uncultured Paraburkholderia sp.]|nr:MAG: hypothetical protein CPDRYDRY_6278 [uncultured Paraburkholderia sp.]CAH2944211.1 MAG: hypothetical protein CPDRYMAC_6384 [uncultured Paraburkholderia sp.]
MNSGTWARLIQITPELRGDAARFAQMFQTLKGGTMEKLDALPGLVTKTCTVVAIWCDAGARTKVELRHVKADGNGFVLASDMPASLMEVR